MSMYHRSLMTAVIKPR